MSWAELFGRAATYGVTEEQVIEQLDRQRRDEATEADEP